MKILVLIMEIFILIYKILFGGLIIDKVLRGRDYIKNGTIYDVITNNRLKRNNLSLEIAHELIEIKKQHLRLIKEKVAKMVIEKQRMIEILKSNRNNFNSFNKDKRVKERDRQMILIL